MGVNAENLLQLGFVDFGSWDVSAAGEPISYTIDNPDDSALAECRNALYAFVKGQQVLYIGKTTRGIRRRFVGYCKPGKTQATNRRCHDNIKKAHSNQETIRIFLFLPVNQLQYGDYEINLAAGLEDSLIEVFSPAWNGHAGKQAVSEEFEREVQDEPGLLQENLNDRLEFVRPNKNGIVASFDIELGDTYYKMGVINPGKEMNIFLGEHGDTVVLYLGSKSSSVASTINKTANRSGAVRILGNNLQIARWFQQNFHLHDVVKAEILSPHEIFLLSNEASNER